MPNFTSRHPKQTMEGCFKGMEENTTVALEGICQGEIKETETLLLVFLTSEFK